MCIRDRRERERERERESNLEFVVCCSFYKIIIKICFQSWKTYFDTVSDDTTSDYTVFDYILYYYTVFFLFILLLQQITIKLI